MKKYIAFYLVLALFAVAGLGMAVRSLNDSVTVQGDYINNFYNQPEEENGQLGITTKSDFQAVDITATGDLSVGDDATVGDDLTVSGTDFDVNSLETYVSYGAWTDASTTFVAVVNPFTATASAELILTGAAATTTTVFVCGTSTTAYPASAPAGSLMSATIATNTQFYLHSGVNNGSNPVSGVTAQEIMVDDTLYVVCYISSSGASAVLGSNNTWDGYYKIKWTK
jgi:hypothetical protein